MRGKERGQGSPLAAGPDHIEERVQHSSHIHVTVSPARLFRGNERLDDPPLLVAQRTTTTIIANPLTIPWLPVLHPGTAQRKTARMRFHSAHALPSHQNTT